MQLIILSLQLDFRRKVPRRHQRGKMRNCSDVDDRDHAHVHVYVHDCYHCDERFEVRMLTAYGQFLLIEKYENWDNLFKNKKRS